MTSLMYDCNDVVTTVACCPRHTQAASRVVPRSTRDAATSPALALFSISASSSRLPAMDAAMKDHRDRLEARSDC
jgi:hypothetical protein